MVNFKHGMKWTREYTAWRGMIARCEAPTTDLHALRYQQRGISVAAEWRNDFKAFFEHVGPAPNASYTLDRINNDRGYEPGNVRWATRQEQARNRSTNSKITIDGKEILLLEEAERRGIPVTRVRRRLNLGWTLERALSEPIKATKLSETEVIEIFYNNSGSYSYIADLYGVDPALIGRIKKRKVWKHITSHLATLVLFCGTILFGADAIRSMM